MRIATSDPKLPPVRRGNPIVVHVDGQRITAFEGETIAAVLWAEGIHVFRHTTKTGQPRSVFCGIGICFDCLVTVDGVSNVRACVTSVVDGMVIETRPAVKL
jgi:predicted molibdopterin-dependent oxidoreductase YjgC